METNKKLTVEVAYALPEKQCILSVEVEEGSTIADVIQRSGIFEIFPGLENNYQQVGIFGKKRELSDKVQQGDRIEIYRPLIRDPKETRRLKAKKTPRKK